MEVFDPVSSSAAGPLEELAALLRAQGVPVPERALGPLVLDLGAAAETPAGMRCAAEDFERVVGGLRLLLRATGLREAVVAAGEVFLEPFRPLRRLLPRRGELRALVYEPRPGETGRAALRRMLGAAAFVTAQVCRGAFSAYYEELPFSARLVSVWGPQEGACTFVTLPFGATALDALTGAGALGEPPWRVIVGGLLDGAAVTDLNLPLADGVDALILQRAPKRRAAGACIRCGRCRSVCPAHCEPYRLALGRRARLEGCTQCGACSFFCPARLPLAERIAAAEREEAAV